MKEQIKLYKGLLEVTSIWEDRLVIAELLEGSCTRKEVVDQLNKAGINHGILDKGVEKLALGQRGQIPVAMASVEEELGKFSYNFEALAVVPRVQDILTGQGYRYKNYLQVVRPDSDLVRIEKNPCTVLKYPDGRQRTLDDIKHELLFYFAGTNTTYDINKRSIISTIGGSATRNPFGMVNVFPIRKMKSVGSIHGTLNDDKAYYITGDVHSESEIISPSNIRVNGLVRSSNLTAEGSICSEIGFDNIQRKDMGSVKAGKDIHATAIRSYNVWAGRDIFCYGSIDESIVQARNNIIAPGINASEIRLGGNLYVNDINEYSKIYLGSDFVKDTQLKELKSFHIQHKNRLKDLEEKLNVLGRKIEYGQKGIISHLQRLQRISRGQIRPDAMLQRLYNGQKADLLEYKQGLNLYKQLVFKIIQERVHLAYYRKENKTVEDPKIYVYGTIAAGTTITTPNQVFKLTTRRSSVIIRLNEQRGGIQFIDMKKMNAS